MDPASPEYLVVAIILLITGGGMAYKFEGEWKASGVIPAAAAVYMFQMYNAAHKDD